MAKCPCIECEHFCNQEYVGWEDTHNGFYIVHCEDGKDRAVSITDGCSSFKLKTLCNKIEEMDDRVFEDIKIIQ
jgi:hypothetical protein